MAAIIRDAHIDGERLVLAVVPSVPPAAGGAARAPAARADRGDARAPGARADAAAAPAVTPASHAAASAMPATGRVPPTGSAGAYALPAAAATGAATATPAAGALGYAADAAIDVASTGAPRGEDADGVSDGTIADDWMASMPPLAAAPFVDPAAEARALDEQIAEERRATLERAEQAGYAAGLDESKREFADQLAALRTLIESLHAVLEADIAGAEDVIVEIAFEAVCKILGDAMVKREGVVLAVREIVRGMREREPLLLRVAPADYDLLIAHRAQLLQGGDGKTIDLVTDERVALGGCFVETSGGTLDGRLETQLQRLVDTLTSARRMPVEGQGLA